MWRLCSYILTFRVQGKQLSLPSALLPPSKVSVSSFSVCFQSSCLRCLRRRASSLSLTTTSWERRSTRRRGFAFPECSCRANSPSPANHRAPDVCQLRNARRFRDWNVRLKFIGKNNIYSMLFGGIGTEEGSWPTHCWFWIMQVCKIIHASFH